MATNKEIETIDISKIAKATADEIELRELHKELEIKAEINEQIRRRNKFLSKVSGITILFIALSAVLYFTYIINVSIPILIWTAIYVGIVVGLTIPLLIDAIMDYIR